MAQSNVTTVAGGSDVPQSSTAPPDGDKKAASAGIASAILFVAVFVVVIVIRRKMHQKKSHDFTHSDEEDEDDSAFEDTGVLQVRDAHILRRDVSVTSTESMKQPLWKHVNAELKEVILTLRIDIDRLVIGKVIGKGQFGLVNEAKLSRQRTSSDYRPLTHQKVAVKSLKSSDLDLDTVEAFLTEGSIMKKFKHNNVLSLIGVAIAEQGLPLIVLPYMANGNLKKYIMRANLKITVRELLQFGLEVANGMNYLSEKKFVHRDLAARNCMVDSDMRVKVADFGLSRDMYTKEYYSSDNSKAPLPVKWMALESLIRSVYTTKTDVWSFGVLLWELLTRGAPPYPDVANWDIKDYVQSGRRMAKSPETPSEVYELMLQCWAKDPSKRPTFQQIITKIQDLLEPRTLSSTDDVDGQCPSPDCNLYTNVEAASLSYMDGSSTDVSGETVDRSVE